MLVERDREPARDALRVLEGMRPCEVDARSTRRAWSPQGAALPNTLLTGAEQGTLRLRPGQQRGRRCFTRKVAGSGPAALTKPRPTRAAGALHPRHLVAEVAFPSELTRRPDQTDDAFGGPADARAVKMDRVDAVLALELGGDVGDHLLLGHLADGRAIEIHAQDGSPALDVPPHPQHPRSERDAGRQQVPAGPRIRTRWPLVAGDPRGSGVQSRLAYARLTSRPDRPVRPPDPEEGPTCPTV